jgi:hypothetical protein
MQKQFYCVCIQSYALYSEILKGFRTNLVLNEKYQNLSGEYIFHANLFCTASIFYLDQ